MTVKELRDALAGMPDDAPVVFDGPSWTEPDDELASVRTQRSYFDTQEVVVLDFS